MNPVEEAPNYKEALIHLRIYYSKIVEILEAVCASGGFAFRNSTLNRLYVLLKVYVEKILQNPKFIKLSEQAPQIPETIVGNLEELSNAWEFLSPEVYEFLGRIDKAIVLSNAIDMENEVEMKFGEAINAIDKAIKEHRNYSQSEWDKFMQGLDKARNRIFPPAEKKAAIKIFIDRESGICRYNGAKKLCYPISENRFELVKMLCRNEIVTSKMGKFLYGNDQLLSTAIKKANELFRKKLALDDDLIIHLATDGYQLNKSKFEFETKNIT